MNDDKIYVRIVCDEFGCEVRASLKNNGGKEYIRKNALLEYLHHKKCNSVDREVRKTFEEVIEKVNSI